eukprot:UN03161
MMDEALKLHRFDNPCACTDYLCYPGLYDSWLSNGFSNCYFETRSSSAPFKLDHAILYSFILP